MNFCPGAAAAAACMPGSRKPACSGSAEIQGSSAHSTLRSLAQPLWCYGVTPCACPRPALQFLRLAEAVPGHGAGHAAGAAGGVAAAQSSPGCSSRRSRHAAGGLAAGLARFHRRRHAGWCGGGRRAASCCCWRSCGSGWHNASGACCGSRGWERAASKGYRYCWRGASGRGGSCGGGAGGVGGG